MTYKLTVNGLVQGVGFRPYVQRVAEKFNLYGNVKNTGGIVEIYINADDKILDEFVQYLISHKPVGSQIIEILTETLKNNMIFDKFEITQSDECDVIPIIPPDIGVCDKCMTEFYDKANTRYAHPFISCISCGPRYSIIKSLPYDRINTTMSVFSMCNDCDKEYNMTDNRRCYAQTIACNKCGPILHYTSDGDALENAVKDINNGYVIAVRDIGGYHFVCSAHNESAISRLRELKMRDEKPFAVMFYDINVIRKYADVNEKEAEALKSDARPIVLVKKNKVNHFPDNVCKNSNDIGAFLPCNPVQAVLTKECGPLIMTSGNISGEPIITNNEKMLDIYEKSRFLDGVLYHGREILTPLDDSIVRVIDNEIQIIRRGRGYVPLPIWLKFSTDKNIFSAGGDLKASFCLMSKNRAYMSQYFGDLENKDCADSYTSNIKRMSDMLNIKPQITVCDHHPMYFSNNYAKKLCENPMQAYHHHSHIASVMAEHGLSGDVLGFSFDGTGYGQDGTIWGGEVLLCRDDKFERVCHLSSVKLLGGDEGSKNAKNTADCYLISAGFEPVGTDSEIIKSALQNNINTVKSSSMGRLFDAVSSLLGISDYNDYEGKCAILLEMCADTATNYAMLTLKSNEGIWDTENLIKQIVNSKNTKSEIALGFHYAIANAVIREAQRHKIKDIALSGGVFMNRILTELCIDKLRKNGYNVYINRQVPTNDGGIALGQAYIAYKGEK